MTAPAERGLVLVVEDEPAIADLVRTYLTREGFCVHVVRDGETALASIARDRPAVVILDVGLPGIDGTRCAAVCGPPVTGPRSCS